MKWIHFYVIDFNLVDSPKKGPVILNLNTFFVFGMNKLLNKQLGRLWFKTPQHSQDFIVMDRWYTKYLLK